MRFKVDENLGPAVADLLREAGHDVTTVVGQGHRGISDSDLLEVCRTEGRCLVTMDMGFSDPFENPPGAHSGIAVFRLRTAAGVGAHRACARTLLRGLDADTLPDAEKRAILWIVEPGRIRSYRSEIPEED